MFFFSIKKNWVFTKFYKVVHHGVIGNLGWKPPDGHQVVFGSPFSNLRLKPLNGPWYPGLKQLGGHRILNTLGLT
jgi:hypothetical protein